jgi:hypothetical protein
MFCTQCGVSNAGENKFCSSCGAKAGDKVVVKAQAVPEEKVENYQLENQSETSNPLKDKQKTAILIGGLAVALVAVFIIITFSTARHWTKTIVPERAETFSAETYFTGNYNIVDDNVTPCWIRQSWVGCSNLYVDEYNATCAAYSLTSSGSAVCANYRSMIEDMQSQSWSYVASLGGYGRLTAVPEEATRQVSNNDYRPAKTKEAVCYLGFLGECA